MKCVVCGTRNWRKKFKRLGTDFVECVRCNLVRMNPIPSAEQISAHYAEKFVKGNYALIQKYDKDYQIIYQQFLEFTLSCMDNPHEKRLLDIGCFTGRFLDQALKVGFLTYGIEYQPEAAAIANIKHRGRIYCGPIEQYTQESPMDFDVVTLFGLIEHVTEPNITVQQCANLLKKDGLLIIQTPNTASTPAKLTGRFWPVYAPVEHIYYFSSRNIAILLKRYGFDLIDMANHWKRLPLGYVYNQFENFGPEYYNFLSCLFRLPFLSQKILVWNLPFYVGEMLLLAKKINKS